MRRLAALTLVTVAAAFPSIASGGALIHPSYWRYQNWMDRAQVPAPPGRITFRLGASCDLGGLVGSCAIPGIGGPDDVRLAPEHEGNRAAFLHEIGHVHDFEVMTPAGRRAFSRLADRPEMRWDDGTPPTFELYASAYSACGSDAETPTHAGQYGWWPTPAMHRLACQLIRLVSAERWRALPATSLMRRPARPRVDSVRDLIP